MESQVSFHVPLCGPSIYIPGNFCVVWESDHKILSLGCNKTNGVKGIFCERGTHPVKKISCRKLICILRFHKKRLELFLLPGLGVLRFGIPSNGNHTLPLPDFSRKKYFSKGKQRQDLLFLETMKCI